MGVGLLLADVAPVVTLEDAFKTALGTIQTTAMAYIGDALPVGLIIMGTMLTIGIGVKAIKRFTH